MKEDSHIIRIPKPQIFSHSECLHFLDRGYDDCLYTIENDRVVKAMRIETEKILFEVTNGDESLEIRLLSGPTSKEIRKKVRSYVIEWFDLHRDLKPFYRLLNRQSGISWMTDRYYGLRLMGIPDLYEALCWCVIGQQINLTFAYKLKRRLVETYGSYISYNSKQYYLFPDAEVLAGLKVPDLRELQFSRQKAEYIIGISKSFADHNLSKQELTGYKQTDAMLERLMEIRGIGVWTANYVLMKSLKRMDCITYGDTGLQSAVSSLLDLSRKPIRREIDTFFEPFAGWESYLVIYLWRTLS